MQAKIRGQILLTTAILLVVLLPLLIYYFILGNIPTVTGQEALELLNHEATDNVLVDVRSQEEYSQEHIEGALNWPLESILMINSVSEIPDELSSKIIFLICNAGFKSASASRHLIALGNPNTFNIKGGMQEWVKIGAVHSEKDFSQFTSIDGDRYIPFRDLSKVEQIVPVLSGFVIKPVHMLLSLILIIILWKSNETDLIVLRWGIILFLLGEAFCAVNYLFFKDDSLLADYLHNSGMMLGFGFVIFAALEGVDKRIAKISAERKPCSMVGLCGKCFKTHEVSCKLQQLFLWACIGLAVVAPLPLLVEIHAESYITHIFGTLHQYAHLAVFQYYEFRFIPVLALICFTGAYLWQIFSRETIMPLVSRILLSGGAGALMFGFFRLLLGAAFVTQRHWSDFWEEATELLFIVMIALVLWYFRERLLSRPQRNR